MGDEQDDQANALADEQAHIRHLQVEIARKKELQKRVSQKKEVLQNEFEQRQRELGELEIEFRTAKERKGARTGKKDEAQEGFMKEQVEKSLKMRIPLLADPADAEGEHDLQGKEDETPEDQSNTGQYHDTVQINYVYFAHPRDIKTCEEFVVTYRIGTETKVEDLLRDACSYWGCLTSDYGLYLEGAEEERPGDQSHGDDKKFKPQPGEKIVQNLFPLRRQSKLYLVRKDENQDFVLKRQADIQKEKKASGQKSQEEGRISNNTQSMPFVEALRHWPGVYHPVKDRSLDHRTHRAGLKFRNICIHLMLIFFCCLSIYVRSLPSEYVITSGVTETVALGVEGESSHIDNKVQDFFAIKHYDEIWEWAGGSFHHQLFNENSTLRRFYTPVGFLRVRQQKARALPGGCRRELPASLRRPCYYPNVLTQERQENSSLTPPVEWAPYLASENPGMLASPSPLDWHSNNDFMSRLHGRMQYAYDGSGYSMDFSLGDDINETSATFMYMLPFMRDWWVDQQTRMLVFEFLTANYNLDDGYAQTTLLFELGPSGIVLPFVEVQPLWIRPSDGEQVATFCDAVKGIIVFGYVCLIGFYFEIKRVLAGDRTCFAIFLRMGSLLDIAIGICLMVTLTFRSNFSPPEPTTATAFFSYNYYAALWQDLKMCEAILLMLAIIRWTTFLKVVIGIYRFWKTFEASLRMFTFNLLIIIPPFLGVSFFGNALFSDVSEIFATMQDAIVTMFLQTQAVVSDPHELQASVPTATLPYLALFFVFVKVFIWNTFLAITAHSYFQISLLESSNPGELVWTFDQWMDFILWPQVYTFIFQRPAGSSRKTHSTEKVEEKDDDDDDDDDDDANN